MLKRSYNYGKIYIALSLIFASLFFITTMAYAASYPFSDDMEGQLNWVGDIPWDTITTDSHSPTHSWTDSPGGYYQNNVDVSLTLGTSIDLSTAENPRLKFWHRYQIELGYDFGYVEISTDGGNNWIRLTTYTGFSGDGNLQTWIREEINLTDYVGETNVLIRFRLVTDKSIVMDGWYIDDVSISNSPHPVTLFPITNPTCTSLDLSWTENIDPNFVSYKIYRDTTQVVDQDSRLVATITDQTKTVYTDTGLRPGTTYYYRVYVVDDYELYAGNKVPKNGTTIACGFPFFDDFEAGQGLWELDPPWGLTSDDSYSGTYSLTDSPGGNYGSNVDASAYIEVPLIGANRPLLTFWHRYNLESYADFGYVEVSNDNRSTWKRLFFATGFTGLSWQEERIDLSEYASSQVIWLRFRMVTDASVNYDGWYIDDVSITENTATIAYPFFDDMEGSGDNYIPSSWRRIATDGHSGNHSWTDSPDGSNPAGSGWQWIDATYSGDLNDRDRYRATILVDTPGTYDYAYRYSMDGGLTWVYADLDGNDTGSGGTNGYSVSQAGSLLVEVEVVEITDIWTSKVSGLPRKVFSPGDGIGLNARFMFNGSLSGYKVIAKGKVKSITGKPWEIPLERIVSNLSNGSYTIHWDKVIPDIATPGSKARVIIWIKVVDIGRDKGAKRFRIRQ